MILLGAGSSVPFDIPGMQGFTDQFLATEKSDLLTRIADSIPKSRETVGVPIPLDLETLLSVLTDLSGASEDKPISLATMSFLLANSTNIEQAREKFGGESLRTLKKLKTCVFNTCMKPIKTGKMSGSYSSLDSFYGPLFTLLNRTSVESLQESIRNVFSTNWDLCFKQWMDYVNLPFNDATILDRQSLAVLGIEKLGKSDMGISYVPLHGSLDLVKMDRPKGAGVHSSIQKIADPIGYFEDKPDNIERIFMIYPLEAVGFEESIKSPYLDMLYSLRSALMTESVVITIGYSMRDPTIGSIFEQVIADRTRRGEIKPLSQDYSSRKTEAASHQFKIVAITPDPSKLAENLKRQKHTNLLNTFIPIRAEFPKVTDKDFEQKYADVLEEVIGDLISLGYFSNARDQAKHLVSILASRYNIPEARFEGTRRRLGIHW